MSLPRIKGESVVIEGVKYTLVEEGVDPDPETGRGMIWVFADENGKRFIPSLAKPHYMIALPEGS